MNRQETGLVSSWSTVRQSDAVRAGDCQFLGRGSPEHHHHHYHHQQQQQHFMLTAIIQKLKSYVRITA